MISIQEHLNKDNADQYLDDLAELLWDHLNKKLANGQGYKQSSLIKRLDKIIVEAANQDYLVNVSQNDEAQRSRHLQFYNFLKTNNYQKLKALIVGRPTELLALKGEIMNILQPMDLFTSNGRISQTPFGKYLIDNLFIYKAYRQSAFCANLVARMELSNAYCPYCNYRRIQVVDISDEEDNATIQRAYLDIDHFYPKSQNPFFGLSFYNLIPSCHDCNSTEKGDKDFCITTHTNPFHKSYNLNHLFEIDNDAVVKGNTTRIILKRTTAPDDFMDRDLHLNQRYEHTYLHEVNELIAHYINYQHYRNSPDFVHDYKDVLLQRVPETTAVILKREGGKLFRDVVNEIDVFDLLDP